MTNQITSYLTRELRELKDVTVVNDNYEYALAVVAVANATTVALSVLVLEPRNVRDDLENLEKKLRTYGKLEEWQTDYLSIFKLTYIASTPLYYVHENWIYMGPVSSLKGFCQQAVAQFDGSLLNENRQATREFMSQQAQRSLMLEGFAPGDIDGNLGPKTREALRAYQKKHGLPMTGDLDAATRKALGL